MTLLEIPAATVIVVQTLQISLKIVQVSLVASPKVAR